MGADKSRKRAASADRREQDALSPEDRWLLHLGGGGGVALACATCAMIVWLFWRHPEPRPAAAPVVQAQPEAAQPPAEPDAPTPAAPSVALAPAGSSPQPGETTPPAPDDPLAPFLRMELSAPATDFAFDDDHGHLAAIGPWGNAVGVVTDQQLHDGGSAEDVAVVALQGAPTAIRYKPLPDGGLFVVGQHQPDAVVLIDPVSREVVDTIPLEVGSPYWIAGSSNPESADVYLATINSTDSRSMLRLDAQGRSITATWPKVLLRDFAVSYDGAEVYCRVIDASPGRGPLRPSTSEQFHWHFHPERDYKEPDRRYVIDPLGRFVVTGNRVWTPDFRFRQQDLQFEAQAFLPDRPWAAGIEDFEVVVGSINDGRIVRRFPLPPAWHRIPDAADRQRQRDQLLETWAELLGGQVFADPSRDQFVLATARQILSFPLKQLDLPDEPLLLLSGAAPASAVIGIPLEHALQTAAGSPTIELIASPDQMTLNGDLLQWTPQPADVGEHEVAVRISAGDVSREQRWLIHVAQTTLPVSFLVRGCDVAADGQRLVAWGHDWPAAPLTPQQRVEYQPPNGRLAVIGLPALDVLAETPFDAPIRHAEFCGREIVVADRGQGQMQLVRLSSDDLRPLGESSAISGPMTSIGDRVLAIRASGLPLEQQWHYYSFPDLKPRDPQTDLPPLEVDHRTYSAYHDARRLADGWLLDGALWDDEVKKPVLLIAPEGFLHVSAQQLPSSPAIVTEPVLAGFVYDRVPTPQRRALPLDSTFELDRERLTFSPHVPAELVVRFDGGSAILDVLDLTSAEALQSIPLGTGTIAPNYPYADQVETQIVTSPDAAFVTLGGRTFVISLEPRPAPFRIEPRQSTLELAARLPTRVTYEAQGAASFVLEIPALGAQGQPLRLESKDGAFRVQAGDLDALSQAVWRSVAQRGAGSALATEMDDRTKRAGEAYKRQINRRQPPGVPVCLDAFVQATHEDGTTAVMHHAYVLVIPTPIFAKNKP